MGGAPLLIGMLGCYLGGTLSDRYIRVTGDRKRGRRIFGMVGYGMAGACYLIASGLSSDSNPWLFACCLIMVGFFNDLIMGPAWATCQDVGRRYSAMVAGFMNMVGNIGSATGIFVTGRILASYTPAGGQETEPRGLRNLLHHVRDRLRIGRVSLAADRRHQADRARGRGTARPESPVSA